MFTQIWYDHTQSKPTTTLYWLESSLVTRIYIIRYKYRALVARSLVWVEHVLPQLIKGNNFDKYILIYISPDLNCFWVYTCTYSMNGNMNILGDLKYFR